MNNFQFPLRGGIFEAPADAGVVQDKKPPRRLTAGVSEPVTAKPQAVTTTIDPVTVIPPADNRPTHHGSETRKTELVAGRVSPHIKSEVNRLAKLRGETPSKTVAWLVEQALARTIAEQFGVMIRQTIQEAVRQEFQKYTNRMGKLTFSAYLAAEQGRLMHIDELRKLLDNKAVRNLPQMIRGTRQDALNNLKFYNYSLDDIEAMVNEKLPWQ
jgi:hypothetical protein